MSACAAHWRKPWAAIVGGLGRTEPRNRAGYLFVTFLASLVPRNAEGRAIRSDFAVVFARIGVVFQSALRPSAAALDVDALEASRPCYRQLAIVGRDEIRAVHGLCRSDL